MELIRSLLNNSDFNSLVNTQVLMAVLIALIAYRLVSPIIDLLNPFSLAINTFNRLTSALVDRLTKARYKQYTSSNIDAVGKSQI